MRMPKYSRFTLKIYFTYHSTADANLQLEPVDHPVPRTQENVHDPPSLDAELICAKTSGTDAANPDGDSATVVRRATVEQSQDSRNTRTESINWRQLPGGQW